MKTIKTATSTVRIVKLPARLWRLIEGGCRCKYCQTSSRPPAWDALAINEMNGDTWAVHAPELYKENI